MLRKLLVLLIGSILTSVVSVSAAESLSFFGVDFNTTYKEAIKIFESRYKCEWNSAVLYGDCSGITSDSESKKKSKILAVIPQDYWGISSTRVGQFQFLCPMYNGCGFSREAIMEQIIKYKFQNRRRPETWLFCSPDSPFGCGKHSALCVSGFNGEYVCVKDQNSIGGVEMIFMMRGDFTGDSINFD